MARVAWESGLREVVCTPHVHPDWQNGPHNIPGAIAALRAELLKEKVPLSIVQGAEIGLARIYDFDNAELRALSLGGAGRWLLIEMPFTGWPIQLPKVLRDLEIRGFRALLAHPERSEAVQRSPDRMRELIGLGALAQVTADSFLGEKGPIAKRTAETLLLSGTVHVIGSDAHSASWRPPSLGEGVAAARRVLGSVGDEVLEWAVNEGPRLMLTGKDVRPPRLDLGAERPRRTAVARS